MGQFVIVEPGQESRPTREVSTSGTESRGAHDDGGGHEHDHGLARPRSRSRS